MSSLQQDRHVAPVGRLRDAAGIEGIGRGQHYRSCGEILFAAAEVEHWEHEIATALVARGVRTGPEFTLVRKAAGLRATEVAEIFGVRPETVSRWERGEVEVPRTAAYALGELYEHPKITDRTWMRSHSDDEQAAPSSAPPRSHQPRPSRGLGEPR